MSLENTDIVKTQPNPYDEMPYHSSAFTAASPLLLRSIATLLGLSGLSKSRGINNSSAKSHLNLKPSLKSNSPTSLRVLELGCSFGGNLLSYALYDPSASLHGIDLSPSQISQGKHIATLCGASNLTLEHLDIMDFSNVYGDVKYDYIIAHGVYSWVPNQVREAILALISRHLAPFGVAYISFNVLPGWYDKMPIRHLMLSAYKQNPSIAFVRQALEVYKAYLLEHRADSKQISFIEGIKKSPDHYIRHEWLSDTNDAFYFDEFITRLSSHGLGYLCEADLCDILSPGLANSQADEFIRTHFTSHASSELMLDIFGDRMFRRSLITHASNIGALSDKEISADDISKLHIISILSKTETGYKDNTGVVLDNRYEWLYEIAAQVSPASISLPQLLALFGDSSYRLQAYAGFIKMLDALTGGIKVDIYPRHALKYEPGKTRINPRYKGYLKYFASTKYPVIDFADAFNYIVPITQKDAKILLCFNSKMTKAQITNQISNEFNINKTKAREYLDELEKIASHMYLFEEI